MDILKIENMFPDLIIKIKDIRKKDKETEGIQETIYYEIVITNGVRQVTHCITTEHLDSIRSHEILEFELIKKCQLLSVNNPRRWRGGNI